MSRSLASLFLTVEFPTRVLLLLLVASLGAAPARSALLGPDREVMRGQVKSLLEKKQWAEAIALLRPLQEELGSDPQMSIDLSKALIASGHRVEALKVIRAAASRAKGASKKDLLRRHRVISRVFLKNDTFQLYQDGLDFLLAGKFRAAIDKFEVALRSEPGHLLILARLGQAFTLAQEEEKARSSLEEAYRIDSEDPEIQLWLGRALTLDHQWDKAVSLLSQAKKELPDEELATVWLSEALSFLGDRAQAILVLERDLESYPSRLWVKARLAELLARSELPVSLEDLRRSRILTDAVLSDLEKPQAEKPLQSLRELEVRVRLPEDFKPSLLQLKRQVEAQLSRVGDKT